MRYLTDATWERHHRVLLAGSPLRLFRLTDAGAALCAGIEQGTDVGPSTLVDRLVDAGAIHPDPARSAATFSTDDVTIVTPQLGGSVRDDRDVTVDDGSTPPIVGAALRLTANTGPAAARNAGRTLVTTALIAFVDADVDLDDPGWLDPLLAHFTEPTVGLVAPRVVGDPSSSLDLGSAPARIRAGSRVSYVPAAAIVVRATAFDDVGGFDIGLRFGEDVDFVWRLDAAGWRCRYEPRSTVHHQPRRTWRGRLAQQVGYGSSAAPLALRHPRAIAPFRANGWMATTWTSIALGHPIVATAAAVGNAVIASRDLDGIPRDRLLRLTTASYSASARQLAAATRRVWWPIALVLAVGSRRARWIAIAAIAANPRATPTDVAYGWGLWREMWRRRTWRPIVPEISAWRPTPRRRPSGAPARRPAAAAR